MEKFWLILFLLGVFFLFISVDLTFTGAVVGTNIHISNFPIFILSLCLFTFLLISFTSNKSLEAIVVPTGTIEEDKKRLETAMHSYFRKRNKPYIMISGEMWRDEKGNLIRKSQQYSIYKELRDHYGLKPSNFIIEGKSQDTLENFIYSLKKLKKKNINYIKIVTNQTHYWRFKLFEQEAKEEGLIEKSFKLEPLYTSETPKEFIYGLLAYIKDYLRIKSSDSLEEARHKKSNTIINFFKNILTK